MKIFFRKRKPTKTSQHYLQNKEKARTLILERLDYFNKYYDFEYNRVSIRNQRTRWGSCSSKGNLNFNYKILFLPMQLADYIIVHELCHVKELNHSKNFWSLVQKTIPDYKQYRKHVKTVRLN